MFISNAHLTTITGEGDHPAGWYTICTLQVRIATVPCRLEQKMDPAGQQKLYPAGWNKNCIQQDVGNYSWQVDKEYVPCRLEWKLYPAGWCRTCTLCILQQDVIYLFILLLTITVSFTQLSVPHCKVSNEYILVNNELKNWEGNGRC